MRCHYALAFTLIFFVGGREFFDSSLHVAKAAGISGHLLRSSLSKFEAGGLLHHVGTFTKNAPKGAPPGFLETEAASLEWLGEATAAGGARVARVQSVTPKTLEREDIREGRPSDASAQAFGSALARTHKAGAPRFGAPPPKAPYCDSHGNCEPNFHPLKIYTPSHEENGRSPLTWGQFFADYQVMPIAKTAYHNRRIDSLEPYETVAKKLRRGDYDDGRPPARIHGDLWSGNLLWDKNGEGVLIDPIAHGGHPLTDIALLDMFGNSHFDSIVKGYEKVKRLPNNWQKLMPLHQLPCALIHAHVFGGSYKRQADMIANRYA